MLTLNDFINECWNQGLSYKTHYLDSETKRQVMCFVKHRDKVTLYLPIRNQAGTLIEIDIR